MKILVVNTKLGPGGASGIARSITDGYEAAGHTVHWWTGLGDEAPGRTFIDPPGYRGVIGRALTAWWLRREGPAARGRIAARVRRVLQAFQPASAWAQWRGHEDFNLGGFRASEARLPWVPDVLHLHNLHGFTYTTHWDLRALPRWSQRVPTIVSMHDPWLVTGHCAHFFGCERWRTGCGSCPDLTSYPHVRRDATARNWRVKADLFSRSRLHVVGGCDWVVGLARDSLMAPGIASARTIRYGTDLERFRPAVGPEKRMLRERLGLPREAFVVVYGAEMGEKNPFRDFRAMRGAVAELARLLPGHRVVALELGGLEKRRGDADGHLRWEEGYCVGDALLDRLRSADVLLHAAIADTSPLIVLEAMACGLPVVSTQVGGIPEQITPGETGLLTPKPIAEPLAEALLHLAEPGRAEEWGTRARRFMEMHHPLARMQREYTGLAEELDRSAARTR